ncbi:MAG: hypothetical protein ACI8ZB_001708 [Desulforhopalus sp.]|jgi:hypothetical protein
MVAGPWALRVKRIRLVLYMKVLALNVSCLCQEKRMVDLRPGSLHDTHVECLCLIIW